MLLVREQDLAQDARCLWKFGQDRFQNKSLRDFVPSIVYHWYFENESSIIPETLQHVRVRKTKVSFKFWMDYSLENTQCVLPLLSLK